MEGVSRKYDYAVLCLLNRPYARFCLIACEHTNRKKVCDNCRCLQALKKDREKRFATCREMALIQGRFRLPGNRLPLRPGRQWSQSSEMVLFDSNAWKIQRLRLLAGLGAQHGRRLIFGDTCLGHDKRQGKPETERRPLGSTGRFRFRCGGILSGSD